MQHNSSSGWSFGESDDPKIVEVHYISIDKLPRLEVNDFHLDLERLLCDQVVREIRGIDKFARRHLALRRNPSNWSRVARPIIDLFSVGDRHRLRQTEVDTEDKDNKGDG